MGDELRAAAWLLALALLAASVRDGATASPPPRLLERPPTGAARLVFGLRLDVNHASSDALEALPGIGTTRARAIVAERPFCSLAELERVAGVGPVTRARIAALLDDPQCPPEGLSSGGSGAARGLEVW